MGPPGARRYDGDSLRLISLVREWLDSYRQDDRIIPDGEYIFERYKDFISRLPELCAHFHLDPNRIKFPAYISLLEGWL
jgi:hypothetical protein